MKNAISYYYNLYPNDIHQIDDKYSFLIDNNHYILTVYKRDNNELEDIYKLSNEMLKNGIYNHQIILNKDSSILTIINNTPYILMKLYDDMKSIVKIDEIITFTNLTKYLNKNKKLKRDNWGLLWSNKIDYFEYQLNQFGKKYPIIRESFAYFVGLAENGISLYNSLITNEFEITVSHVRINSKSTLFDLYNPLNFIFDYQPRDISEYLKSKFINKEDIFEDLKKYINSNLNDNYKLILLFIRMLYPSFYFDKYEEIMSERAKEEELLIIIDRTSEYEELLKKLYNYLNYYIKMPDIEWLKKSS